MGQLKRAFAPGLSWLFTIMAALRLDDVRKRIEFRLRLDLHNRLPFPGVSKD
jgi:hypothetical protein